MGREHSIETLRKKTLLIKKLFICIIETEFDNIFKLLQI